MIISAKELKKYYGDAKILESVTFSIEEGEKAAFVGVNGAGKTTVFKIIAGEIPADGGLVTISKNASISYLEQNAGYESDLTVYEEMLNAFSDVIEAEREIRELEKLMARAGETERQEITERYNQLVHFYELNDGYSYKSLVRGVIAGLGLDGADVKGRKISQLSGGQKTRVALGKALLKKPDALLLDEPTNHLDMDSLSWLESYLKSYNKTVLLISHDRFFMDSVTSRVIEIDRGKAAAYKGNYSDFIVRREINRQLAQKHYKDSQKEIQKQEESIKLLRSFNRQKSVKRAENIEKRLAKTEKVERPGQRQQMKLSLSHGVESGEDVLSVLDVSKSYGENVVLNGVSAEVKRRERVALIGANGIGKTTLLKILIKEISPDSGWIRLGANVRVGYFDQERQNLNESKTVFQQLHDAYPKLTEGEIRNILAAFLFKGDDVFKPISALSGGERGRVCLADIMTSGANLLILDEPTNHLDVYSKEILEEALLDYGGTVFCVSHDRYFINRIATRVLELTKSGIKSYCGGYDYYLQKKSEDEYNAEGSPEKNEAEASEPSKPKKNLWLERKAEAQRIRKKESRLKRLEEEIAELELKIEECDRQMCAPEVYSDAEAAKNVYESKAQLEKSLEALYLEWEACSEE